MSSIHRQSDSPNASLRAHGCGAYACINALEEVSDWKASGKAGTSSALVRVDRSGVSDAEFDRRGMTSAEVYRSLQAIVASDYRMDLPLKRYQGGSVRTMLAKMTEVGGVLVIAVRYGAVQDAGKGVGSFRLGHWVVVFEQRGDDVVVADSLRRQTVTWPVSLLVRAAESFGDAPGPADNSWGNGRGEGIVVYPWRTWRSGYAEMKGKRDAALKAKDAAVAALEACQANSGTPDPAALKAARQSGIDAATERARTTPNP